jgi:hypothetical protein
MMKTKIISITAILLTQLFLTAAVLAADLGLPILETRAKTVALFKNGLGFVIREGETQLSNGWAVTNLVPEAALGTLWFGALDKDSRLEEVVGQKEEKGELTEAISPDEVLRANIGKRVVLYFDDKSLEGRIKSVPDNRIPKVEESDPYGGGYAPPLEYGTLVIIETAKGDIAVNKNAVTRIEFPEGMADKFAKTAEARKMKFKVTALKNRCRIGISYLEKGITWTPGYQVVIEDGGKARITMQATVVNDVEDLHDADLFFVVGYPNFIYADVLSPMAMRQSLTQFIASLTGGGTASYGAMANVMAQSYTRGADETGAGLTDYNYSAVKGLEGEYEEDLFLYSKQGVTLSRGERASYLVFSDRVNYQHVYEWIVPDLASIDQSGYNQNEGDKTREQVWHSLRLENSTSYPWTTAPALAISDGKPMAQDLISYTPKGSKVNLKLTIASDVKTDRQEYEVERQRDITLYDYSYDLVTVKGELYVKNNKAKEITLDIRKTLTGEVIDASHDGRVQKIAEGINLKRVNPNSVITWEIPVKGGAEARLVYKYKVYVAH